jgi:glycosyltransferase 2 family protein
MRLRRRWISTTGRIVVRAALSAVFVWLALRGIRIGVVADVLAGARFAWFASGLAVLTLSFVIGAMRWRLLARGHGVELGLKSALSYSWIGLFFANVLPTGFGGDAVRAWIAGTRAGARSRVTASVLMDRLVAAWALVAVGAVAVAFEHRRLPGVAILACLLSVAAVIFGSVILLLPSPARVLSRATARWPRVSGPIERVGTGLASYAGRRDLLLQAFAISLAAQVCVVLAAAMLARALGLHLGVGLLAACIPVALLATATPTSVNGLGVREAVFRVLLVPAGVAPAAAVAFSLMTVIAAAIVSLPGALAWIALRRGARLGAPVSPPTPAASRG